MSTIITGLLIPFIGTAAGAGCVFFLRNELKAVCLELERIEAGAGVDDELLQVIRQITVTLDGLKEDANG